MNIKLNKMICSLLCISIVSCSYITNRKFSQKSLESLEVIEFNSNKEAEISKGLYLLDKESGIVISLKDNIVIVYYRNGLIFKLKKGEFDLIAGILVKDISINSALIESIKIIMSS